MISSTLPFFGEPQYSTSHPTLSVGFPILLTTYHLSLASILTQFMARWTKVLNGRHKIKMNRHVYMRAIVPIGVTFSLSLICNNLAYLYLSVAFIQMLKATTPVAVLLSGWLLGVSRADVKVLFNVSIIAFGVLLASIGEIDFVLVGVLFQLSGIIFEALRLSLVQKILSAEYKMDALLSIYYYAPICALLNFMVALVFEVPRVSVADFANVGLFNFVVNGTFAFLLNVAAVSLVSLHPDSACGSLFSSRFAPYIYIYIVISYPFFKLLTPFPSQIGKTSAVVLTLCGVLKDIILVVASMIIWNTQVTLLQAFGYTIALSGIVYFKLGYKAVARIVPDSVAYVMSIGANRPLVRRILHISVSLLVLYVLLRSYRPSSPFDKMSVLGGKVV